MSEQMNEKTTYKLLVHVDIPKYAFNKRDETIYINTSVEELEKIDVKDGWIVREFNVYFDGTDVRAVAKVDDYVIVVDKDYETGNYGIWVLKKLII